MRTTFIILAALALALGLGASYHWLSEANGAGLIHDRPLHAAFAVVATAALTSVNLVLRWLRWGFLLRRFHVRIPTRTTFQVFFATLPAALTPFYLGELLRAPLISRRDRGLILVVSWVWLVERVSDAAALLTLWGWTTGQAAIWLPSFAVLITAPWLLARSTRHQTGAQRLHTAQLASSTTIAVCASISLLAWSIPVLATLLTLALFGAQVDSGLAAAAFARGTLLGGISGIPGGAGVAGSEMIIKLVEQGVNAAQATATVAALRLGTNWYAVALGVILTLLWRRSLARLVRGPHGAQQHFDALSATYADDIPEHVRSRLLGQKINAMLARLPPREERRALRGLDLGCGHGWYAAELARLGYRMVGIDVSKGQIAQAAAHCRARRLDVELTLYDGAHVPHADASFDFVYSINVLHHVPTPAAQEQLLSEVLRVLTPNGVFFLHEMNVENPLFRVYMSYVFPLLKSIDEGTELWLLPSRLPTLAGGAWLPDVTYFTFLPEFLPSFGRRLFAPIERRLERSSLRKYAAHYMAVLRRL